MKNRFEGFRIRLVIHIKKMQKVITFGEIMLRLATPTSGLLKKVSRYKT